MRVSVKLFAVALYMNSRTDAFHITLPSSTSSRKGFAIPKSILHYSSDEEKSPLPARIEKKKMSDEDKMPSKIDLEQPEVLEKELTTSYLDLLKFDPDKNSTDSLLENVKGDDALITYLDDARKLIKSAKERLLREDIDQGKESDSGNDDHELKLSDTTSSVAGEVGSRDYLKQLYQDADASMSDDTSTVISSYTNYLSNLSESDEKVTNKQRNGFVTPGMSGYIDKIEVMQEEKKRIAEESRVQEVGNRDDRMNGEETVSVGKKDEKDTDTISEAEMLNEQLRIAEEEARIAEEEVRIAEEELLALVVAERKFAEEQAELIENQRKEENDRISSARIALDVKTQAPDVVGNKKKPEVENKAEAKARDVMKVVKKLFENVDNAKSNGLEDKKKHQIDNAVKDKKTEGKAGIKNVNVDAEKGKLKDIDSVKEEEGVRDGVTSKYNSAQDVSDKMKNKEYYEPELAPAKKKEDKRKWKEGALDTFHATIPFVSSDAIAGGMVLVKPPAPEVKATSTEEMWDTLSAIKIQGRSVKTCTLKGEVKRVEVLLKTDGRPLHANLDLWHGPTNVPQKMVIYSEDGMKQPFRATFECTGFSNSIGIRNTGSVEMPIIAGAVPDYAKNETSTNPAHLFKKGKSKLIQGKAVYTKSFGSSVESVQVKLESNGRPLNATVELLHGPNCVKQVVEVYSQDGHTRPFYCIFETHDTLNVIRVQNIGSIEFPFTAQIEPFIEDESGVSERSFGDHGFNWN